MTRTLFAAAAFLSLVACKDAGQANVDSCETWVADVSCGETDFSGLVDCTIYEETDCDISGYFDCLTSNGSCDDATGVYDSSGWTTCASEATCE